MLAEFVVEFSNFFPLAFLKWKNCFYLKRWDVDATTTTSTRERRQQVYNVWYSHWFVVCFFYYYYFLWGPVRATCILDWHYVTTLYWYTALARNSLSLLWSEDKKKRSWREKKLFNWTTVFHNASICTELDFSLLQDAIPSQHKYIHCAHTSESVNRIFPPHAFHPSVHAAFCTKMRMQNEQRRYHCRHARYTTKIVPVLYIYLFDDDMMCIPYGSAAHICHTDNWSSDFCSHISIEY